MISLRVIVQESAVSPRWPTDESSSPCKRSEEEKVEVVDSEVVAGYMMFKVRRVSKCECSRELKNAAGKKGKAEE